MDGRTCTLNEQLDDDGDGTRDGVVRRLLRRQIDQVHESSEHLSSTVADLALLQLQACQPFVRSDLSVQVSALLLSTRQLVHALLRRKHVVLFDFAGRVEGRIWSVDVADHVGLCVGALPVDLVCALDDLLQRRIGRELMRTDRLDQADLSNELTKDDVCDAGLDVFLDKRMSFTHQVEVLLGFLAQQRGLFLGNHSTESLGHVHQGPDGIQAGGALFQQCEFGGDLEMERWSGFKGAYDVHVVRVDVGVFDFGDLEGEALDGTAQLKFSGVAGTFSGEQGARIVELFDCEKRWNGESIECWRWKWLTLLDATLQLDDLLGVVGHVWG